jgi:hypothetical protein
MWDDCVGFLTGPKGEWTHNVEQARRLRAFVDAAKPLFDQIQSEFSTQVNECYHSMRAKYASKRISWKASWGARSCAAVLEYNVGPAWPLHAYDSLRVKFGWPELSPEQRSWLERTYARCEKRKQRQRDPAVRELATMRRLQRRGKISSETAACVRKKLPMHGRTGDSDDEPETQFQQAPHSVDMTPDVPMGPMDLISAFSGGDGTYGGWHGLSNPDLHTCHFNASAVALGCLSIFSVAFLTRWRRSQTVDLPRTTPRVVTRRLAPLSPP